MAECSLNELKTLCKKEKLLIMNNSVFKRLVLQTRENQGLFGKGLNLYHTVTTLRKRPFENILGKGENAGNQHFLLFPKCFLPFPIQIKF